MISATCPTQENLRDWSLGKLADERSDELHEHLRDCPSCQEHLGDVRVVDDSFVMTLRDSDMDVFDDEPACQLAVAKALGSLAAAQWNAAESQPVLPTMIGEYEILKQIGSGGMSSVYLARHTKLSREVAVKVLASHRLVDPRSRERFTAEMRTVGGLSHPQIVTAYDAREVDDVAVLVMEYIDGYDVGEIVRRCGALLVADACAIAYATAEALQYVGEQGLVHRDVKPSNVMLNRSGEVKLLDLGLARLQEAEAGTEMTATGQAMGTADYIAPEQVNDSRAVDARADIYSLGCTLYKMLSGRAPFADEQYQSAFAKLNAHVQSDPRPLAELCPTLPEPLVSLVHQMLRKDPVERPQTYSEVCQALSEHTGTADLELLVVRADHRRADPGQDSKSDIVDKKTSASVPSPRTVRRLAVQFVLLGFLIGSIVGYFCGVIITVKKPDGTTATVEAPDSSHTKVDEQGNVTVELEGRRKSTQSGTQFGFAPTAPVNRAGTPQPVPQPSGASQPSRMSSPTSPAPKNASGAPGSSGTPGYGMGPPVVGPPVVGPPVVGQSGQPSRPFAVADQLQGIWRIFRASGSESLDPQPTTVIFYEHLFILQVKGKAAARGQFWAEQGGFGAAYLDVDLTHPETTNWSGAFNVSMQGSRLEASFNVKGDRSTSPSTGEIMLVARRIDLPDDQAAQRAFLTASQNQDVAADVANYLRMPKRGTSQQRPNSWWSSKPRSGSEQPPPSDSDPFGDDNGSQRPNPFNDPFNSGDPTGLTDPFGRALHGDGDDPFGGEATDRGDARVRVPRSRPDDRLPGNTAPWSANLNSEEGQRPEVQRPTAARGHLQDLGLAMHNFAQSHGHRFPASAGATSHHHPQGKQTKPSSWRVQLLPFVGHADLYEQYRFDEDWDSEHNRKFLSQMPAMYRHPKAPSDTTFTSYVAITGDSSIGVSESVAFREIQDGLSNTLLLIETETQIPWTKPEDLTSEQIPSALKPYSEGELKILMADGVTRTLRSADYVLLPELISRKGGETIVWPKAPARR